MMTIKEEATDEEDSSTMRIKVEMEPPIDDDDQATFSDSSIEIKQEYNEMEAEADNDGEEEWNPDEEFQIKDEITIEETKLEQYSEFEQPKLKFNCKLCEFSCASASALTNHGKIVHPKDRGTRCGICYLPFKGTELYEKHIKDKHQGFNLKCKICSALYMKGQETQHSSECPGQNLLSCTICDKCFLKRAGIVRHLDVHGILEDDKQIWISEILVKEQFFSCAICEDDKAYGKDPYWKHIKEEHNGYHVRCSKCRKTFKAGNSYNKHIKYSYCTSTLKNEIQTTDERKSKQKRLRFKCKHCDSGFAFQRLLTAHMKALHQAKDQECSESEQNEKLSTQCRLCDFSCMSSRAMQTHIETVHAEDRTARCGICYRSFKGTTMLEKHAKDEHQGFELECKICLKLYNKGKWKEHRVECPGRLLFACGACEKIFLKKEGLLRHLDEHGILEDQKQSSISETRQYEQFFSCVFCDDDYAFTKDPFWKHVKEQHNGDFLRCPDCGKTFNSRNNHYLHIHKLCKVGGARERFVTQQLECQHCSKMYHSKASLEAHIARIHTNKPSKCGFCKEEFPTVGAMIYHRTKEHIKPPLSCSQCDRKFHGKYKLRRHEASHKPLVCETCGLTFKTQIFLANHVRLQHLKRKNTTKSAEKNSEKGEKSEQHEQRRSGRLIKVAPIESAHGEETN